MYSTLIQMTALMLCGAGWGILKPNGLTGVATRKVLTSVVYYFFLPAMVLNVLWQAEIGITSMKLSALGCSNIAIGIIITAMLARLLRLSRPQTGTLILASAYANVTYLGLPVLEQTLGEWSRSVVIQVDLFAAAPMVFTVGIAIARHFGEADDQPHKPWWTAFNAPPFWAAFGAVLLNSAAIAEPIWLKGLLDKLSNAVAPLMLFSLGMALSWQGIHPRNLRCIIPATLIKLGLLPLVALYCADWLELATPQRTAAILDLAMPSMVIGIVLCDQYRLDSALYATLVTITTAFSLISLPFWYQIL